MISNKIKPIFIYLFILVYFALVIINFNFNHMPYTKYAIDSNGIRTKIDTENSHYSMDYVNKINGTVSMVKPSGQSEFTIMTYEMEVRIFEMIITIAIEILALILLLWFFDKFIIDKIFDLLYGGCFIMKDNKKKILILIYIILFVVLTIFFTPYKAFYAYDTKIFTGISGFQPIFAFSELTPYETYISSIDNKTYNRQYLYSIDFQVLFIELLTLTVVFTGLYLIIRNKKEPPQS